ncbi:MAG: heparinase [Pirellulaceae bacterium]|nr:heparinase [Pirellulaceae bacterium]
MLHRRAVLVLILLAATPMLGANVPDAARVKELTTLLPATPRGVGRPIDDREAWAAVAESASTQEILKQAEARLATPMPEATEDLYLDFSRTGNRTRYQHVASNRHDRIRTLTMAECLENRGRFLPAIEQVIRDLCAEKTWVLPAHDRGLTNIKGTEVTIDLDSSAVAWDMATADYWLGDRLRPETRKLIREQLEWRIFKPFEGMALRGKPRMWWLATTNNWNAVCLSNTIGAALAVIESPERRAQIVAIAEHYIEYFLKGFTPDGYCSEGMGYWCYGFGHYVMLAETLHQQTGGRLDMMADPRVKEIAQFGRRMEMNPGVYPPFADCPVNVAPTPWLMHYLARRFDFAWDGPADSMLNRRGLTRLFQIGLTAFPNSVSGRDPVATLEEPPLRTWFSDAGILICRPAPGAKRPLAVAMKGGHNAEHHNHNDVGSFVVALGGATPLVDPGSETYTRRTFSPQRYQSNVINSFGHPVPRIGGKLQQTGRQAAAAVLATQFDERADTLALDLSAAYDVEGLKQLKRTFVYSREGAGSLTVTDEAAMDRPTPFETALITFDPWRQVDATHLRMGEGGDAVDVEIDAGGEPVEIRADEIQEDLRGHACPTRVGIVLSNAVRDATVTLTIRPAE